MVKTLQLKGVKFNQMEDDKIKSHTIWTFLLSFFLSIYDFYFRMKNFDLFQIFGSPIVYREILIYPPQKVRYNYSQKTYIWI